MLAVAVLTTTTIHRWSRNALLIALAKPPAVPPCGSEATQACLMGQLPDAIRRAIAESSSNKQDLEDEPLLEAA